MPGIKFDSTLARLIKDMQEVRAALRHVTTNLPLYDVANENTPASLAVDQDNYVPGNYDVLRINATANVSITGIANGKRGRFLEVINVGTGRISFPDESASSLAINRIATPYDQTVTLLANARVRFYYDSTQERWTVSDLPNIQGEFGKFAIISHSNAIVLDDVVPYTANDVTPDTIVSDEWGYWDNTSKVFRIPVGESGLYSLVLNFAWSSSSTNDFVANTAIYKNTSTLIGADIRDIFSAYGTISQVINFLATAGDTVNVIVRQEPFPTSAETRDLRLVGVAGTPIFVFSKLG